MGYVRKIAYEEANRSGAELYEVKSTERTEGSLGFWWCGRYGMHKWKMHTLLEEKLCYPAFTLIVQAVFYGIYFGKMLAQKRHGIRTHQIGRRKEKELHTVETLMSVTGRRGGKQNEKTI